MFTEAPADHADWIGAYASRRICVPRSDRRRRPTRRSPSTRFRVCVSFHNIRGITDAGSNDRLPIDVDNNRDAGRTATVDSCRWRRVDSSHQPPTGAYGYPPHRLWAVQPSATEWTVGCCSNARVSATRSPCWRRVLTCSTIRMPTTALTFP